KLAPYGDPLGVPLPSARMKGNPLDLSFSGLKTAVLRLVQAAGMDEEIAERRALFRDARPAFDAVREATPRATLDLIASFQRRVVEELLDRAVRAAEAEPVRSIIVSGGVAANRGLRTRFADLPY